MKPSGAEVSWKNSGHRLTYYKTSDGWRWRVRSRNGRIVVASSEAFTRLRDAGRNFSLAFKLMRLLGA